MAGEACSGLGFAEGARRALLRAQQETQRRHHDYIGTEHILLGLLGEGDNVPRLLTKLGARPLILRTAVEFIVGTGQQPSAGPGTLTTRSKKVVRLAQTEALWLSDDAVGSEHLLLALLREGEGVAAGVLVSLGLSLARVRGELSSRRSL